MQQQSAGAEQAIQQMSSTMDKCDNIKRLLLGDLREAVRREVILQLAEGSVDRIINNCDKGLVEAAKKVESAITHKDIGRLVKEETERVLDGGSPVDAPDSSLPDLSETWVRKSVIRWVAAQGHPFDGESWLHVSSDLHLALCVTDTPNKACGTKDCGWSIQTRWNFS